MKWGLLQRRAAVRTRVFGSSRAGRAGNQYGRPRIHVQHSSGVWHNLSPFVRPNSVVLSPQFSRHARRARGGRNRRRNQRIIGGRRISALVIVGLWITQAPGRGALGQPRPAGFERGLVFGLLLIVGFGVGNALRGLGMRAWSEAIFGSLLGTGSALLCQAASIRAWPKASAQLLRGDRRGLAIFAASGVATACGSILTSSAMAYVEIAIATLITFTTPLVVFPVSVYVFGNREGLRLRAVAGAAMVLAGVALLALR